MITAAILDALNSLLFTILGILKLPNLPEPMIDGMNSIFHYLTYSESIIAFFLPKGVTLLLPVFFSVYIAKHTYHFVMWIIKKLPFAIN